MRERRQLHMNPTSWRSCSPLPAMESPATLGEKSLGSCGAPTFCAALCAALQFLPHGRLNPPGKSCRLGSLYFFVQYTRWRGMVVQQQLCDVREFKYQMLQLYIIVHDTACYEYYVICLLRYSTKCKPRQDH